VVEWKFCTTINDLLRWRGARIWGQGNGGKYLQNLCRVLSGFFPRASVVVKEL
jgi:hypothetical protein